MLTTCPHNVRNFENQPNAIAAVKYMRSRTDALKKYLKSSVPENSARYRAYSAELANIRAYANLRAILDC